MKRILLPLLIALSLLLPGLYAAEKADAKAELQKLIGAVRVKMQAAQDKQQEITEKDLAPELKDFDKVLAAHKGEKTDEVAEIVFMKAMLYVQVLENPEKGEPILKELQKDYPETAAGKRVPEVLESIQQQAAVAKIRKSLTIGSKFPDFNEKDLDGKPLSIARFKGKVVLVDFWATWCGPCVAELPNVLAAYKEHHAKGFEIIGISLDKDKEALTSFIKKKEMTWPQYFDGKGWQNKLSTQYGVDSIPATFLLDGEGKIIAKNLRGEALAAEVAKGLSAAKK